MDPDPSLFSSISGEGEISAYAIWEKIQKGEEKKGEIVKEKGRKGKEKGRRRKEKGRRGKENEKRGSKRAKKVKIGKN
jgi:hypothetical protein